MKTHCMLKFYVYIVWSKLIVPESVCMHPGYLKLAIDFSLFSCFLLFDFYASFVDFFFIMGGFVFFFIELKTF